MSDMKFTKSFRKNRVEKYGEDFIDFINKLDVKLEK